MDLKIVWRNPISFNRDQTPLRRIRRDQLGYKSVSQYVLTWSVVINSHFFIAVAELQSSIRSLPSFPRPASSGRSYFG
jgi:hypothetical protein